MKTKCYCGHTTYCDCGPDPNESLKSAKKKYDEFQIESDDINDWDTTLIEYLSWDEIYDDYVGEADIYEFVQWLKDNFQVPNKL
jgi:hypothetical protein